MKEILIRIGCVFLGVFITLGVMLAVFAFDTKKEEKVVVSEIPITEDVASAADERNDETFAVDEEIMQILQLPEVKTEESTEESGQTVSENTVIEPKINWIEDYPKVSSRKGLEEKMKECSSYQQSVSVNSLDRKIIESSTVDFSDVKITIMGDSITTGVQLEEWELHAAYPNVLKEILGCAEVVNLGIGGSSVSSAGNYAMIERWSEIPKDSDIIIIFGGSNDCLFETNQQFGNIEYEQRKVSETFCGDLDEMLSSIERVYRTENKENYPKLIYINPPCTILSRTEVLVNPDEQAHQSRFAEAINTIAPEYGFEVIDLYNNNILNSRDPEVNEKLIPDGIHPNAEGHRILAEHIASQIIQRVEQ